MMRSRRELTADEVDAVIDAISMTAENLEEEAERLAQQPAKMNEAANNLKALVRWLSEETP